MPFTAAEENYIKTIFQLQLNEGMVSTNSVAATLETSAASVTDMLKKLKLKKLLVYEKYKGFKLNNEGKKTALEIIRKHRLWETFLVNILHFKWDEVHEVAEQLEHIQSNQLINHLDDFLGNPQFDPHGDPIPDSTGKMPVLSQINLTKFPLHIEGEICSVGSQSSDMLSLLSHKHIEIGSKICVEQFFAFDESIDVKINNNILVNISAKLAQHLFVKKLNYAS
ncbi:MAG TPA: metal-dependent transcriptional regulator [Sediminibacterium sp.]|jgi:DtxR family Mn-dependent transcriptional regulator|nr:metal-dependent transcriptional regulator [Sediminibacterium sp.]HPH37310.1 metal-dependent transcriptional regulator [Sediminibacterium sp.]